MGLGVWLRSAAWAGIVYAVVVWAAILIDKLVQVHLPRQIIWFWAGIGVTPIGSLVYAIWRWPSAQQAAVAIDDKLALKERFSTALYVRPSKDPFAMAAVRDAEKTADNVSLHKRFPVQYPMAGIGTVLAVVAVLLTLWFFPKFDLLGVRANKLAKTQQAEQQQRQAREAVKKAIAEIEAAPKAVADKQEIRLALNELKNMRDKPVIEPEHASRTAQKAEQDVQNALKERIKQNQDYAVTQEELKGFKSMEPPSNETGPLADAHRALSQGKFDQAVEDLSKAVNNFDKMSKKDQQKSADQMKNMANALQKMANDPSVQKQVQKQLQQMGANQKQAQQISQLMQQAAAGDKQAQQQLQQMTKQLAQQMNQKSGTSPQQQRQNAQQVQQAMQQMQQKMNAQMNAQQLAQSAQALAQAMQQSARGGTSGQSQQANSGKIGNNKGNQQGQQGQQGQQAGGQQMANAAQQMQQQLQQMQAVANDAQEVAAAQGGAQGDGNQQGNNNGNRPNPQGGNGQGPWGQNQGQPGPAQGGAGGIAKGNNRPRPEVAPFSVKNETDISDKLEKGKVLASTFVKAGSIKGDAKMQLHEVLPSVEKDATDEIDEQRIPRQDQDVVRGYFGNLQKDADSK